jgi:hypothetical protein
MLQIAHSSLALSPIVICTAQYTAGGDANKVALGRTLSGSDCTLDPTTKCSLHVKQRAVVIEQQQQHQQASGEGLSVPVYRVSVDFEGGNRCEVVFTGTERPFQIGATGGFTVRKAGEASYKICPFGTVDGKLVVDGGKRTISLDGSLAMCAKNNQSNKPHILGMNW